MNGKWHSVSELPTQPATPRPWQGMVTMTEVLIILCLYLNVSGLNLSRASQWTLSYNLHAQQWPPTNPCQLWSSPRFSCQIQWQRKCCPVSPTMAQRTEHWSGTDVTQPPETELERQRGKQLLQSVGAKSCGHGQRARTWLFTKNWNMSVWTDHTTPLLDLTCITTVIACLFSNHHTQCSVILQGLPPPSSLHTQLSYPDSGFHLPAANIATFCVDILGGCGRENWETHLTFIYICGQNDELVKYVRNPGINDYSRKVKALVAQLCLTLCEPMDCSLPGSSVYGILQARILEWVAIPFSRGSFQPSDRTRVSCIAGRFFTVWVTQGSR